MNSLILQKYIHTNISIMVQIIALAIKKFDEAFQIAILSIIKYRFERERERKRKSEIHGK